MRTGNATFEVAEGGECSGDEQGAPRCSRCYVVGCTVKQHDDVRDGKAIYDMRSVAVVTSMSCA